MGEGRSWGNRELSMGMGHDRGWAMASAGPGKVGPEKVGTAQGTRHKQQEGARAPGLGLLYKLSFHP